MIAAYLLKLAVVLPLMAALIYASLWLLRRVQAGHGAGRVGARAAPRAKLAVVDTVSMGAAGRIAVVEFDERRLLVAITKTGMALIGEERPRMPFADLVTMTLDQGEVPRRHSAPTTGALNWAMVR